MQVELTASRDAYAELFEFAPVAYITLDREGAILEANLAAATLLGVDRDNLLRRRFADFVCDDTKRDWYRHHAQVFISGGRIARDLRLRKHDGTSFVARVTTARRGVLGPTTQSWVLLTDVSEQARAVEALRESERLFRVLFEQAPVGVILASAEGSIRLANGAFVRMLGYDAQELSGVSMRAITHPDDLIASERLISSLASGNANHRALEKRYIRKDGEIVWARTSVSAVRGAGARLELLVAIVEDISELVRAEQERMREVQELARVERVARIGEIAASLAHELNQPLTGILCNAEAALAFLRQPRPDLVEACAGLEDIVRDDLRAAAFIRSIRSLLRREAPNREPLDINDAVREVLELTRSETVIRNIPLRTRLGRNLPRVSADPVQIRQVLLNLVLNAEDAMAATPGEQRGVLVTTSLRSGMGVALCVSDTGPGIAPKDLEGIFDAFHSTREGGLGVGLAISRTIVETHGGKIWAENRRGGGARVCFVLPQLEEKER